MQRSVAEKGPAHGLVAALEALPGERGRSSPAACGCLGIRGRGAVSGRGGRDKRSERGGHKRGPQDDACIWPLNHEVTLPMRLASSSCGWRACPALGSGTRTSSRRRWRKSSSPDILFLRHGWKSSTLGLLFLRRGRKSFALGFLFLRRGWNSFALAQGLQDRNVLHFKFDRVSTLFVKVFGSAKTRLDSCVEDSSGSDSGSASIDNSGIISPLAAAGSTATLMPPWAPARRRRRTPTKRARAVCARASGRCALRPVLLCLTPSHLSSLQHFLPNSDPTPYPRHCGP